MKGTDEKKIIIVSPFQNDSNLYPHLKDFLSKLELTDGVEYFYFSERGLRLEELFSRPFNKRKLFKWLSIIKRTILIIRKFNKANKTIIAIDNFIYLVCCKMAGNAQVLLWSHDFVTLDKQSASNFWQKLIASNTQQILSLRKKIIIQSAGRLKLFEDTHRIKCDLDPFFLPVSLTNKGVLAKVPSKRLPILLQIGGINSARSNSDKLIMQYQTAENFELMLHGYFEQEIVDLLNNCQRVPFLSSIPLSSSQLVSVVAKCDIGFVSYVVEDSNFKHLTHASGQVAEFLRAGKPLVVHGGTDLNEWVLNRGIGIAVTNTEEIDMAVASIVSSYELMSLRAREVFEEDLLIEKYMDPIRQFIANP